MSQTDWLTVRVRLADAAAFQAQMAASGATVKAFGDEAQVAGDKTAFAAEKAFLLGEGMYSLRRYGFYALTAVGATGGAVLKMGYDFDEAKSKGVDALTALTGGARNASTEVSKLIALTHSSGLGLSTLVTASQNMLTFGFSVKQTNQYLEAFANYAGVKGLGQAGVTSLTDLFNKIRGQGFMTSRELTTLVGMGIPGQKLMSQGLGLTPGEQWQLQHGQLQIPASTALPQLAQWLQTYAASQPKSLSQIGGIAHSYLSQIAGTLGSPIFSWLQRSGPGINGFLGRANAGAQRGGMSGLLGAVDPSGALENTWKTIVVAGKLVGSTLMSLWTVARPVVSVLALLTAGIMGLASHSFLLKAGMEGLIAYYIVSRAQMALDIFWRKTSTLSVRAYTTAVNLATEALVGFRAGLLASTEMGTGAIAGQAALGRGALVGGLARRVPEIAFAIGAMHLLSSKKKPGDTWTAGGVGHAISYDVGHLGGLMGMPFLDKWPHLAAGGTLTSGGGVMVGELGPELLNLPAGATVTPLGSAGLQGIDYGRLAAAVVQGVQALRPTIQVNRRTIGELAFQAKAEIEALS